jgi:hypothetical protein
MNSGRMQDSQTESLYVEANANVNVNRFTLPKDARELIIAVVVAASILVNVVLFSLYFSTQRELADAYKDIKTQVWVKQDKDEEKFQKFVAGPYADLAAQVKASQILFAKCKESK